MCITVVLVHMERTIASPHVTVQIYSRENKNRNCKQATNMPEVSAKRTIAMENMLDEESTEVVNMHALLLERSIVESKMLDGVAAKMADMSMPAVAMVDKSLPAVVLDMLAVSAQHMTVAVKVIGTLALLHMQAVLLERMIVVSNIIDRMAAAAVSVEAKM